MLPEQRARRDTVEPWFSLGLFAMTALVLGWGIGGGSLWNGDDTTYALMAREMRQGWDVLHLRLDGAVLHQRPPLFVWLLVISTSIFGDNEFGLRLPAVLMAAGSAVLVWRLAQAALPRFLAGAAGALFPTLALPAIYARTVTSDTTLVFFTLLSIHLYVRARRNGGALWPFGLALGAALMTKQIVGLLPLVAPAAELLARGRKGIPPWRQVGAAALAAFVVAGPWHLALLILDGRAFLDGYLGYNVVQRASSSVLYATRPTFYLETLWDKEGPLIVAAAVGLVYTAVRAVRHRNMVSTLVVLWPVAVIGVFSLASTRLDYYLLPAYPAIAILLCAPLQLLPERGLSAAVAVVLVLASATVHLPDRMRTLDYSHELRVLAERAAEDARQTGAPHTPLFVVDELHLAPRYYSRLPTFALVTRRSNYDRMMTMELFREPGTVLHVTAGRIPELLADQPRWLVIEPKTTAAEHPPPPNARLLAETPRYVLYAATIAGDAEGVRTR